MTKLLDQDMIQELREIMEDDFSLLLETFLHESAKQHQAIARSWQLRDMDLLRRSAHSLKGSCANMGATSLRGACESLEYSARDSDLDLIPVQLAEVTTQLSDVCLEVQSL